MEPEPVWNRFYIFTRFELGDDADQSIYMASVCFIAYGVQVDRTLSLEKKTSDDHRADDLLQLQTGKKMYSVVFHTEPLEW